MSDYSDIQQELDDFKNAVYGEEVRDSMVSAIKKIHDLAESAAGAPDASSATAGQAPIADGAGGWQWGDVQSGDSVPTEVRQAILALFQNGVYTRDDMSDEVAVVASWASEVTSISVSPTTLSINGMNQRTIIATTTPAGGAVTWSSSDESIATVAGGVVTPTGVNGTCTITASSGGKSATCAVTVSGFATLLSIDAVYTQSGTVYNTDTLDSLKSDLVVTANWSDGRSVPVTDYTLQGELTEGASTIVVAYGGKTATFTVTVTAWSYYWSASDNELPEDSGFTKTTNGTIASYTLTSDGLLIDASESNSTYVMFSPENYLTANHSMMEVVFKLTSISQSTSNINIRLSNGTSGASVVTGKNSNVLGVGYKSGTDASNSVIVESLSTADIIDIEHTLKVEYTSGEGFVIYFDGTQLYSGSGFATVYCTQNRIYINGTRAYIKSIKGMVYE